MSLIDLILALTAACTFALGNVAQKAGMNHGGKDLKWYQLLKSPWWLTGMSLSCIAILIVYWVTARAELSFIQPILALNPLISVFLAAKILGESVSKTLVKALFIGLVGVLFLAFSPRPEEMALASESWFWMCLSILVLMGVVYKKKGLNKALKYSLLAGIGFGLATVLYKVCAVEFLRLQGDLGLFDKVKLVITNPAIPLYIFTYVVGFLTSQFALMNGKAALVIPVSAMVGTLVPVAGGILIFSESLGAFKLLGLFFILVSLLLYSRSSVRPKICYNSNL